jgi:hypothetical protein
MKEVVDFCRFLGELANTTQPLLQYWGAWGGVLGTVLYLCRN